MEPNPYFGQFPASYYQADPYGMYQMCPPFQSIKEQAFQELQRKYEQLKKQHEIIKERNEQLERVTILKVQNVVPEKKTRKRRNDKDIDRFYQCPYPSCSKEYASNFALNLHLKNKHKAGSKKEREEAAVSSC